MREYGEYFCARINSPSISGTHNGCHDPAPIGFDGASAATGWCSLTVRTSLVGAGVCWQCGILEGNEEVINARSLQVVVGVIRHAKRGQRLGRARNRSSTCSACRASGADGTGRKTNCAPISSVSLGSGSPRTAISSSRVCGSDGWPAPIPGWSTTPDRGAVRTPSRRMLCRACLCHGVLQTLTATAEQDDGCDRHAAGLPERVARTAHPMIRPIRASIAMRNGSGHVRSQA